MTTSHEMHPWRLRHAWHSESDRAVLAMCARQLADAGLRFEDASTDDDAHAFKLHGFELVEAHRTGMRRFLDLRAVVDELGWASAVDPRAWRFMRHGEAVFGIPMAIHQSNSVWGQRALADELGPGPAGLLPWLRAATRRLPRPLAVGREAWQLGLLFETLYAARGPQAYRRALVDLDPAALAGEATLQVLEELLELRALADESAFDVPWRAQLQQIDAGERGAMVMGDWVAAAPPANVVRVASDARHVHIVDFFVPAVHGDARDALEAARQLAEPGFQARIATVKGSAPAVGAAPAEASTGRIDFPSFTFDQCVVVTAKQAVLACVAEHFLERRSPALTARRLAGLG